MALLEGLDAIDWAKLSHAYGPATDVPDLLRALVHRKEARERVQHELYGNVIHQGTVWSASSKVVPFFVEILTDGPPDRELRRFCLKYLSDLAGPEAMDSFPSRFDPDDCFADCSAERTAPLLRERVAKMTSSPARGGAALVALALLEPAPTLTLAEELMRRAPTPLIALHAACAATIADPRQASAQAKELVSADAGELGEELSWLQDNCRMHLRCTL